MTNLFTNDGSNIITQKVFNKNTWNFDKYEHSYFDIEQTIGLQFSDDLLKVSVLICHQLNQLVGSRCFILGDTSFSECCVDEIAGQRLNIDAIVHYGHACLVNSTGRVPVLYVFGNIPLDYLPLTGESKEFDPIIQTFVDHLTSRDLNCFPLLITYDFRFKLIAKKLCEELLINTLFNGSLIWSEPFVEKPHKTTSERSFDHLTISDGIRLTTCGGRSLHLLKRPKSDANSKWIMLHVCDVNEEQSILPVYRLLVSNDQIDPGKTFIFDPIQRTFDLDGINLRKLMKRRTYLIAKAKDARFVGILIGTLSIKKYRDIADRLKRLIKKSGRQCITLMIGRINPAKLANIPGIDILVLIACPEVSLIDNRDFLVPTVTPFEMECALHASHTGSETLNVDDKPENARYWTEERFWIDFQQLLPGGDAHVSEDVVVPDVTEPFSNLSLIDGRLRLVETNQGNCEIATKSTIAETGTREVSQFYWNTGYGNTERTWFGLDPQFGNTSDASLLVKQGRSGSSVSYTHESQND